MDSRQYKMDSTSEVTIGGYVILFLQILNVLQSIGLPSEGCGRFCKCLLNVSCKSEGFERSNDWTTVLNLCWNLWLDPSEMSDLEVGTLIYGVNMSAKINVSVQGEAMI